MRLCFENLSEAKLMFFRIALDYSRVRCFLGEPITTKKFRGSVFILNMGLQCSKQAVLKVRTHSTTVTRLGPEGECLQIGEAMNNERCTPGRNTTLDVGFKSKERNNFPNVSKMEKDDRFSLVNLPAEGKVENSADFVELPPNLKKQQGEFVELPPEVCHSNDSLLDFCRGSSVRSVPSLDCLSNDNRKHQCDEDTHWTYTLYDFQGRGIITEKDFQQLVRSIYTAVDDNHHRSKPRNGNSHALKVHVEIEHKNKCTPSKSSKGLVLPPPNSQEAEKISNYIREKVIEHRVATNHCRCPTKLYKVPKFCPPHRSRHSSLDHHRTVSPAFSKTPTTDSDDSQRFRIRHTCRLKDKRQSKRTHFNELRYTQNDAHSDARVTTRPPVWPGEASPTRHKKPHEILHKKKESTELCFCKRMLGLDYPCNHGNSSTHRCHYYIPAR